MHIHIHLSLVIFKKMKHFTSIFTVLLILSLHLITMLHHSKEKQNGSQNIPGVYFCGVISFSWYTSAVNKYELTFYKNYTSWLIDYFIFISRLTVVCISLGLKTFLLRLLPQNYTTFCLQKIS